MKLLLTQGRQLTMRLKLSPKQRRLYDQLLSNPGYMWLVGAVRSGKTFIGSLGNIRVGLLHPERESAFVGRTLQTLTRNVINPLIKFLRQIGIACKKIGGGGETPPALIVNGVTFWLFGASTKQSADKIQGSTLYSVYGDEILKWDREMFDMTLSRLTYADSCFIGSCNPESPHHWIKTDYIDRLGETYQFYLDDNPSLDEATKARYKNSFSGAFYRRYIMGEWCAADGLIFPTWRYSDHISDGSPDMIAYDYGIQGVTCALAFKDRHIVDEYWHEGNKHGLLTPEEHVDRIIDKLGRAPLITGDPSAHELRNAFRKAGYNARNANNDLDMGIRVTNQMLTSERYKISPLCQNTIQDINNLVWDVNSITLRPDPNCRDHGTDTLRYGIMTETRGGMR